MQTFSFFYGLQLAIVALAHPDNLALAFREQRYMQWMLKRLPSFLSLFFEVYHQTGMQVSIGPRSPKLLWSWSYKHLHFHVTVRCHQGILRYKHCHFHVTVRCHQGILRYKHLHFHVTVRCHQGILRYKHCHFHVTVRCHQGILRYKHLHFHVTVRCHQGILRVILNLSSIPI